MATETKYNDGGTWRLMSHIYYNDGGTWRDLSEVWYKDGSTWRQVFGTSAPSGGANIANHTISSTDAVNGAGYRLASSGDAQQDAGAGSYSNIAGEWLVTGAAADYEVRVTETSGTLSTGITGVWQALSANRTWTVVASVGLDKSCTISVSIRDVATSTVQDTATITLNHFNS